MTDTIGHLGASFTGLPTTPLLTGAQLAETDLLRAIVRHAGFRSLSVFVPGTRSDRELLRRQIAAEDDPRVELHGFEELPRVARGDPLDVFHVAYPFSSQIAYVRERFAPRPFPIAGAVHSVAHLDVKAQLARNLGFASHVLDVAVCSSTALQAALHDIARDAAVEAGDGARIPGGGLVTELVPLGVDLERFHPMDPRPTRARRGVPDAAVVLLCVGRLSPWTKMDLLPLLTAVRRVVDAAPEVPLQLLLVGQEQAEGYAELLSSAAHAMGLREHVRVWTDVSATELPSVYAAADVFVSVSDNVQESFGLAPVEAMASGLPVVLPAWSGYRDLVEDGVTGHLVPVLAAPPDAEVTDAAFYLGYRAVLHHLAQTTAIDVQTLTGRLVQLVRSAAERRAMGEAGRRRAHERYGWRRVVAAYEDLWRRQVIRAQRWVAPRRGEGVRGPYFMDYRRHFAHFASHRASETTVLRASDERHPSPPAAILESQARLARLRWELAQAVLDGVRHRAEGRALGSIRVPGASHDDVTRAAMFLLKHGLLELVHVP